MREVTVRAAAKVNLHLGVGRPREDGFHPLETLFHAVGLYDDVTATAAEEWSLSLDGAAHIDPADVPLDEGNIVDRAARLLAELHGVPARARVRIHKGIPVAGGMAGGSADAAAALVALDRLWDLHTSDADLLRLAARLGSDVPFALIGGNALGIGRGELVKPVETDDPHGLVLWWVLVPSKEGLSTPAVYRRFDELFPDAPTRPTPARRAVAALNTGSPTALAVALHNDLEPAALDLRPDLAEVLDRGQVEGALRGLVSGSGPTCAFLCGSADEARAVASGLQGAGHDVVLVANGAVPGAHVVEYAG
jgi:4-diphosphocytidyl-2-C-methyl-D-erythritol kinase